MKNWMKLRYIGAGAIIFIGFASMFWGVWGKIFSTYPIMFGAILLSSIISIMVSFYWELFFTKVFVERRIWNSTETTMVDLFTIVNGKKELTDDDILKIKSILSKYYREVMEKCK